MLDVIRPSSGDPAPSGRLPRPRRSWHRTATRGGGRCDGTRDGHGQLIHDLLHTVGIFRDRDGQRTHRLVQDASLQRDDAILGRDADIPGVDVVIRDELRLDLRTDPRVAELIARLRRDLLGPGLDVGRHIRGDFLRIGLGRFPLTTGERGGESECAAQELRCFHGSPPPLECAKRTPGETTAAEKWPRLAGVR